MQIFQGGDAEVVEALACKAGLSGFESHRYLHTILHSCRFGRTNFPTLPSFVKRLEHLVRSLALRILWILDLEPPMLRIDASLRLRHDSLKIPLTDLLKQ